MASNERSPDPAPASPGDMLLFTTFCIVGLPVEIQVKDGSFYSGIFNTSSADKTFDIVLKNARKIGRGKGDSDLASGAVIDTLVVQSSDLVQVVVKDFLLPGEGIVGDLVGDGVKSATELLKPQSCNGDTKRERKSFEYATDTSPRNFVKDGGEASLYKPNKNEDTKIHTGHSEGEAFADFLEKMQECEDGNRDSMCRKKPEEPSHGPSHLANHRQVKKDRSQGEKCFNAVPPARAETSDSEFPPSTNSTSSDANASTVSTSPASSFSLNKSSPYSTQSRPANPLSPRENSVSNTNSKESKLNPGAKVFLPSFANYRSAAAASPTISNMDYVSDISSTIPIASAHPSLEINSFASISSLPSKPIQHSSFVASAHGGVNPQYPRPIVGIGGTRQQPVRLTSQFHPVQGGHAYVYPNSHTVMVGRLGQLMYIHPVSQDGIQATPFLSQGSPYPLFAPYQANVQKLQGAQFVGSKDREGDWWRI